MRTGPGRTAEHVTTPRTTSGSRADIDLVEIAGGAFIMGTDEPNRWRGDGESPARDVSLSPFRIGRYTVSADAPT